MAQAISFSNERSVTLGRQPALPNIDHVALDGTQRVERRCEAYPSGTVVDGHPSFGACAGIVSGPMRLKSTKAEGQRCSRLYRSLKIREDDEQRPSDPIIVGHLRVKAWLAPVFEKFAR